VTLGEKLANCKRALASVIGASSLGVTAKVLTDLGRLRSTIGLEIFTITAIIEFIAIVVTSVIIQIGSSGSPGIEESRWSTSVGTALDIHH